MSWGWRDCEGEIDSISPNYIWFAFSEKILYTISKVLAKNTDLFTNIDKNDTILINVGW